ncbi:MAG: MFS transporter [Saprospiraceae bacterium]|nr:MFS transporter [Saprospiraceae bacterium]
MLPDPRPLYTRQFLILCLSHALFGASFTMIIPELPAYLSSLGGEDYKGLIISLFTLTAGLSRPFSGKLTDTIGRIPVMVIGTLVCVVCSLLYPFLSSVAGFLLLRLFHGFSTGFKPTASTAYVADIVPDHRRGEAMGILSVSMNTGASISPPFGSYLAQAYSLEVMFYVSSGLALLSILMLMGLKETLKEKERFRPALLLVKKNEIIDASAIAPAIVTLLVYMSYGVILTIVPDYSEHLGMANKGLFLTSLTFCSLGSRLFAGRASDRFGRIPVLKVGMIMTALSLVYMGWSHTPFHLMVSSGCLGFAVGIAGPSVFAWTIDRAAPDRRGRAVATVYIALEVGIGLGAIGSAWIYANQADHFGAAFYVTAAITILALPYLQYVLPRRDRRRAS